MTVTVEIPTLFRPLTDNKKVIEIQGGNIIEVIEQMEYQYQGIKQRLISEEKIHDFVNIYVNNKDIRFSDNINTPLKEGDVITILPAVAGG